LIIYQQPNLEKQAHMAEDQISKKVNHHSPVKPRTTWLQTWLIGRPLPSADAAHQAIGIPVGLAIFASDALSSTSYATQEILMILASAGTTAFGFAFPISVAIVALLAIVVISYQQTIHAYPGGGGSYIVSRDNLGVLASQIAGASLLTDYILTVSVSVSAGIAQIISAYPDAAPYRTWMAVSVVLLIMLVNLRGVKESGVIFAIPTYVFILVIFITAGRGFLQYLTNSLDQVVSAPALETGATQVVTLFLLLHAFSSGTTALTGVEAISNGITAFKEPRSKNAGRTLIIMAVILGVLFLSITFLSGKVGAIPSDAETVISQLGRTIHRGRTALYYSVIVSTTLILLMAANTAFADFPRLSALQADDKFLPRQLTHRGSRLVYSWGIISLAGIASLIIILFQARVSSLIPLYAIGVFLSFTLSQVGMAVRWKKIGRMEPGEVIKEKGSTLKFEKGWQWKLVLNAVGSVFTGIVMLIFAITKFQDGAWVILILIPALVALFYTINHHYSTLADSLSLENYRALDPIRSQKVLVPVSGIHKGSLMAMNYARSISSDITLIYVEESPDEVEKINQRWSKLSLPYPLVIIDSPYREMMHPLVDYIEKFAAGIEKDEIVVVVVPEFVPQRKWQNLLHTQSATLLRWALRHTPGVVVVDVPYQVEVP
jgi:amino acid transporter